MSLSERIEGYVADKLAKDNLRKADGVWGYSGPNPKHMLFCPDKGKYNWLKGTMMVLGLNFIEGTGKYKGGEVEPVFALTCDDWYNNAYKLHEGVKDQESFLLLDTLQSCNHRKAYLIYQDFDKPDVCIGTWMEVGDVRGLSDYSQFNGHFYTVKKNPPIDEEDRKEREYTQKVYDFYKSTSDAMNNYTAEWSNARFVLWNHIEGKILPNGNTVLTQWRSDNE